MSRRLIIILLTVLIIGVVGGGIAFFINRLRDGATEAPTGQLPSSETGPQQDATAPTGRDTTTLQEAEQLEVAFDQFFSNNLDLSGGSKNVTNEYHNQTPKDARTSATLISYITAQPIITQLPPPEEKAIQRIETNNSADIAAYVNMVANTNALSNKALLADAQSDLFQEKNGSGFVSLALSVKQFQSRLIEQPVPPAAVPLHRLLLGYTELLAATFQQIAGYSQDPVKALVGIRQLEAIDTRYYPLIQRELARLSSLQ